MPKTEKGRSERNRILNMAKDIMIKIKREKLSCG